MNQARNVMKIIRNKEDQEICFFCNAEDSVWLQCVSFGHVYCILHNAEQGVTEKMLTSSKEPWICQNCV